MYVCMYVCMFICIYMCVWGGMPTLQSSHITKAVYGKQCLRPHLRCELMKERKDNLNHSVKIQLTAHLQSLHYLGRAVHNSLSLSIYICNYIYNQP